MERQRERFVLVLEDIAPAGDSPAPIRLKIALKRLLRTFGFRVLAARTVPAEGAGAVPPAIGQDAAGALEAAAGPVEDPDAL